MTMVRTGSAGVMMAVVVVVVVVVAAVVGTGVVVDAKTVSDSKMCDAKSWFAAVRGADLFTVESCLSEHPELGNMEDSVGCTAIVNAAANGHTEVVKLLVDAAPEKVDVNHQCRSGRTAMHHAAKLDSVPMVRTLHRKNGSFELPDENGNTALSIAAQHGNIRTIAYLNSLTVEIFDTWSGSELLWAAAHHNVEHVKIALSREGAHIEERDAHGNTALLWAARTGSVAMLKELLEHGADITAETDCGWTAIFYAAYFRHRRMTEELLRHSVDLHKKDKIGWNPIMWAAAGGDINIISLLHSAGADLQTQETHGWTPLMMAAARGREAAVNYLLRHGAAHWRATNDLGQMAMDVAKAKGHDDIHRLLHHIYQVAEGRHEEL